MSPADNKAIAAQGEQPAISPHLATRPDRVAHELANLLDGSLRNVGLVIRTLRQVGDEAGQSEGLLRRLNAADAAMNQMAGLIRRWLDSVHRAVDLEGDTRSITEAVEHAVRLLSPAAESRNIRLEVDVAERAARLAAGPVYTILANALRNSIEAIDSVAAGTSERGGQILVKVTLTDHWLELRVRDDGPGLSPLVIGPDGRVCFGKTTKPGGHGLGLQLCQDIAQSLSGSLELVNAKPRGAELILRYPADGA